MCTDLHICTLCRFILIQFSFLFFFCFTSSTTVGCGSWLRIQPCPFLPHFGHCMPISYSHYLEILFNLISPSFLWPFSFPYSFHSGRHYLFWHLSLFILSLCPCHLHLSDFVNFTVPAPCDVSCYPLACSFSPSFFFLYETIYFSYNLPFKCSESIHSIWVHCQASVP
jgi:hypothetical protein